MSNKEKTNQHFNGKITFLIPKIIINGLFPLILYMMLHNILPNETIALAVAGAIPAFWTIILWLWSRKINWIGLIAVIGLSIAIIGSVLSGGGTLPLKLYHPIISGAIGLIFLISVLIKKPLMLILLKKLNVGDSGRFSDPAINRKITIVTVVFGAVLLLNAIIHVFMELTLTTGTYLIISRIVTISLLVILFLASKLVVTLQKR